MWCSPTPSSPPPTPPRGRNPPRPPQAGRAAPTPRSSPAWPTTDRTPPQVRPAPPTWGRCRPPIPRPGRPPSRSRNAPVDPLRWRPAPPQQVFLATAPPAGPPRSTHGTEASPHTRSSEPHRPAPPPLCRIRTSIPAPAGTPTAQTRWARSPPAPPAPCPMPAPRRTHRSGPDSASPTIGSQRLPAPPTRRPWGQAPLREAAPSAPPAASWPGRHKGRSRLPPPHSPGPPARTAAG